jgi:hypothetical protein
MDRLTRNAQLQRFFPPGTDDMQPQLTKPLPDYSQFMQQAGMYNAPQENLGQVPTGSDPAMMHSPREQILPPDQGMAKPPGMGMGMGMGSAGATPGMGMGMGIPWSGGMGSAATAGATPGMMSADTVPSPQIQQPPLNPSEVRRRQIMEAMGQWGQGQQGGFLK